MEINTIIEALGIPVSSTILILILSFIKIPKIELNLWGLLGKAVSSGLNREVLKEIESLRKDLDNHIKESEEEVALTDRHRILVFNTEITRGIEHDKQHFDNMLFTIDKYEKYCINHPEFPNNQCLMAIENIKKIYQTKLITSGFIDYKK